MKRIVSAIVLFSLCIGVCIGSNLIVKAKTENLTEILDLLEEDLENNNSENALYYIDKLETEWESSEKVFSSLSETKLIDELDLSFNSLEKYVQADEKEHAIIVIEECRNGLETVYNWQRITVENIL